LGKVLLILQKNAGNLAQSFVQFLSVLALLNALSPDDRYGGRRFVEFTLHNRCCDDNVG
jgi:hypothetical protein